MHQNENGHQFSTASVSKMTVIKTMILAGPEDRMKYICTRTYIIYLGN